MLLYANLLFVFVYQLLHFLQRLSVHVYYSVVGIPHLYCYLLKPFLSEAVLVILQVSFYQ